MPLSKIITWTIVIFIAFWLVTDSTGAANLIHDLLDVLKTCGNDLAGFVNSL